MNGRMRFDVAFKGRPSASRKDTSDPLRILILGDFCGNNRDGTVSFLSTGPREVSAETLDDVLAKFSPAARLDFSDRGDPSFAIRFASMEDFHPDRLLDRVETLRTLSDLRKGLLDPATFEASAAIVRAWTQTRPSSPPPASAPPVAPSAVPQRAESEQDLLERLMGRSSSVASNGLAPDSVPSSGRAANAGVDSLIKRLVSDSSVAAAPPDQKALVAAVDAELGEKLRAVLHHPDFRALEGAWRGVHFLTQTLELDENLKLFILDAPRREVQADILDREDLTPTRLFEKLVKQTVGSPGAELWDVIVGLYDFRQTAEDAELLGRLAAIARGAGAPFLAAADYRSFRGQTRTDPKDQLAWDTLRMLPVATWTGLVVPRFLLRLPYGRKTDAIERFDFEEAATPPVQDDYLWGNPALACACLLGQSFSESGWDLDIQDNLELSGLPTHVYKEDGESKMTPCAEIWMNESEAEKCMDMGLMPCLSIRGRDALRLARFQSISQPPAALSGRWNE